MPSSDSSADSIFAYRARPLEAAQPPVTTSTAVAQGMESPDGVVPRPKRPQTVSGDPTEPQFGNPDLARRMAAQGVDPSLIEALCGPIAAAGALKELGVAADPASLAKWGQDNGEWGAEGMARGGGAGMQAMLKSRGVDSEVLPPDAVQQAEAGVEAGKPVIINFAGHYLLATDYNTQTGQWYVGNTGANALKGGSAWMTLGEMAAAPGTKHELRAFIVPTSAAGAGPQQGTPAESSVGVAPPTTTSGAVMGAMDRGGDIRSFVRERAQAYGIDPNTAEAVVGSEGGFDDWARQSDYMYKGKRETSYGPLQLLVGGGLGDTFMAETGLDPRDPANGPAATDWALKYASQHGWADWHGAQRIGLDNFAGIGATTPTGTPLDTSYLDAARSTTTPGGTPLGRANDSPFAPAETPYTNSVDTSTPPVETPTRNVDDPLAPVRASLDRTGQALSDFGQGAARTIAPLVGGASDAAQSALSLGTPPITPDRRAQDAAAQDSATAQRQSERDAVLGQIGSGVRAQLEQAYRENPGATAQAVARWVRTGDAGDITMQGLLGLFGGPAAQAASLGGGVETAAVEPFRQQAVGSVLNLAETGRGGDLAAAQARYRALPPPVQTALGMVLDPAIVVGPPAGHGAARGVEAAAQEVGRLGEGLVAPTDALVPGSVVDAVRGSPASTTLAARGVGTVAGGVIGAAAPADTPEERFKHALIGAGVGLGLDIGAPALSRALTRGRVPPTTGNAGVDEIQAMFRRAEQQPNRIEKLLGTLGVGQLGGPLRKAEYQVLDDAAYANAVTTEARTVMGVKNPLQTPAEIDAEALIAAFRARAGAGAEAIIDGLGPVFGKLNDAQELADFNTIIKLKRDIEVGNLRIGRGADPAKLQFSGGVTSVADAQAKLAAVEQRIGPQALVRFGEAEQAYRRFLDGILDGKEQRGMLPQGLAAALRAEQPNYSPSLAAEADRVLATSTGSRVSVNANGMKRLSEFGHELDDLPPTTAAIVFGLREDARMMQQDAASALGHALELATSTKGLVQRVPNIRITRGVDIKGGNLAEVAAHLPGIQQPGHLSWFEPDGTRVLLKVPKEFVPLVDGMMGAPREARAWGILATTNNWARLGITQRNPIFPFINAQADMVEALAQGIRPDQVVRGYFDTDAIKAITRGGGAATGWHGGGVQGAQQLQARLIDSGGVLINSPSDGGKLAKNILTLKGVEWYGNKIEWGPRVAAYRAAKAAGATEARAILAARRVTLDFSRMGAWTRKANAYTLFLNAGIQGSAQLGRIARRNPKAFGAFVAGLNAVAFGAYEWNRQFKRPDGSLYYDDIPDYVKQTNLVLMIPHVVTAHAPVVGDVQIGGTTAPDPNTGRDMMHYATIPLRQFAILAAPATFAAEKLHREDPAGYAKFIASLGWRSASPIQGEDPVSMVGGLLPTVGKTAAELFANKSTYTGLPVTPQRLVDLPAARQVTDRTTALARAATGVRIPGVGSLNDAGVSPIAADYAVRGMFGGLGQQATALAGGAIQEARGEPASLGPLYQATVGRVYRDVGGQQERTRGDTYTADLAAAQARAREALQRTADWRTAKDEDARNRLIRQSDGAVAKAYAQANPDAVPDWAQPPPPEGPPKYDPRIIPPELRAKYQADPYQLQRDIESAQQAVAAYTRDPKNNPRPTREQQQLAARAQYVSPAWAKWRRTQRPLEDQTRRTVRGVATAAVAP